MTTTSHVYAAIAEITAELARTGIAKDRRNDQQGYRFRGIDDVYNALAPCLARHKLCVLPRVLTREVTERTTAKGGALFYVIVDVAFDLVSAVDGSRHEARVIGEAMDSGDKATNKAMSAAYKYLAMQTFCIPTEGDNDADATTHEVQPAPIPVDVRTALEDAAKESTDALKAAWGSLAPATRKAISDSHAAYWADLKAKAAKTQKAAA
jgi:hypothetical protein